MAPAEQLPPAPPMKQEGQGPPLLPMLDHSCVDLKKQEKQREIKLKENTTLPPPTLQVKGCLCPKEPQTGQQPWAPAKARGRGLGWAGRATKGRRWAHAALEQSLDGDCLLG